MFYHVSCQLYKKNLFFLVFSKNRIPCTLCQKNPKIYFIFTKTKLSKRVSYIYLKIGISKILLSLFKKTTTVNPKTVF